MEDPRASSQNQPADLHRAVHLHWDLISLHKQCANRLLCAHNIHTGQQSLLFMLKHMGACNQKELARALHISPATIAISLKRLERSGLVRRVPDQQDLRSNRIELTQAGVESADFAEKVIDQITERSFKISARRNSSSLSAYCRAWLQISGYFGTIYKKRRNPLATNNVVSCAL